MGDIQPIRTLPSRSVQSVSRRASQLGLLHDWSWLTYHPFQMHKYHQFALADADPMMTSVTETFPSARTMVDVGSGSGAFAAEAQKRGVRVAACERSTWGRLYAWRQGVRCVSFDLAQTPPAVLDGPFDLAYCFEVAEHVPRALADPLVRFLASLSDTVVFTAAHPGQGGLGHVNEQPRAYWIDLFARHQMQHRGGVAVELRNAVVRNGVPSPWLHENLMVFERGDEAAAS